MPYIKPERRLNYTPDLERLAERVRLDSGVGAGDLNYLISSLIAAWLEPLENRRLNYDRFNAAIGVLESAKLELYRRMVVPYEDDKLGENGDVF